MNTQTQSMKGARTLLLGMLAGASIVAAGVVLARGHAMAAAPAVVIKSDAPDLATRDVAAEQTHAVAPPTIELTRALVVGHRLKLLVVSEQDLQLLPVSTSASS